MNFFQRVKGWIAMNLFNWVKDEFDISPVSSGTLSEFISNCVEIYKGNPYWLNVDDHIKTVNFAKTICSETAQLTMLDTEITITGSARADWLQEQINAIMPRLRHYVEYGCAYGAIILKATDNGVDIVLPGNFEVCGIDGDVITDIVFCDEQYSPTEDKWYTRLERHTMHDNMVYTIENRCFAAKTRDAKGKAVDIAATPWAGMMEFAELNNIEHPLFAIFRTPAANDIDERSPLGLPVFASAVEELHDLDVAYSRNAKEILDSKRTILLDSDRLLPAAGKLGRDGRARAIEAAGLPDMVRLVEGTGSDDIYHEINPTLNTEMRMTGINALLSQIGFKCGFSNGYFVFNEKTGMVTATQVESDDRRTIQLIKDVRAQLQTCIDSLVYALDKYADLFRFAPLGAYEVAYDFADITANLEEDRARCYSWVMAGKYPFWMYLVKYEGYTEDEARQIEQETQATNTLYGADEE